ncbi:MAG: hypothetical protein JXA30_12075, partial [Deltaproteobacteria bacterium]|nr:hypothetical protein [Deltaproteobacteria bacterium]
PAVSLNRSYDTPSQSGRKNVKLFLREPLVLLNQIFSKFIAKKKNFGWIAFFCDIRPKDVLEAVLRIKIS